MSAYFKNYISTIEDLINTIDSDASSENDEEMKIQLQSFRKDALMLLAIAYNNSAIEGKASAMPEGTKTRGQGMNAKE